MSSELKSFLHSRGVPTSRSTPYHPTGNGQCERFVGSVWKAITLCLESRSLPVQAWEAVLPDALHSLRSLLCTATNCTPHERLFSFPRKSVSGTSMPTWLTTPGKVLLRKFVRNKDESLVQEVELLESNPLYAHIKYPGGKEDTVAIKDLAPSVNDTNETSDGPNISCEDSSYNAPEERLSSRNSIPINGPSTSEDRDRLNSTPLEETHAVEPPRRSNRIRKPPDRFGYS